MYGYAPLREILPEITRIGVNSIDLWPKVHGSQREELDSLGEQAFGDLLKQHNVTLGCLSQYKLGPFALRDEIQLARRLDCPLIVTMVKGGKGPAGSKQREAIDAFAKKMRPEFARAADANVTIAIENHGSSLIENEDGIRWLMDACEGPGFGFALAPAHLPQEPDLIARVIRDAGPRLKLFYAWQYGKGFRKPMPHDDEMMQMPGRGPLDFGPLVSALAEIQFDGPSEVMMHPTPRGIPIEPSNKKVTEVIDASHQYLERLTP